MVLGTLSILVAYEDEVGNHWRNALNKSISIEKAKTVSRGVLDVYQKVVESGKFPPVDFKSGSRGTWSPLSLYIRDQTGYPLADVIGVLKSLQALSESGKIDVGYYTPGTVERKKSVQDTVSDISKSFTDAGEKVGNKLLYTAAGLGALYLFLNRRK